MKLKCWSFIIEESAVQERRNYKISCSVDILREIMEMFARLLYFGFALLTNTAARLKTSISTIKDSEEPKPFLKDSCKCSRTTWKTTAINTFKHYYDSGFSIICKGREVFPYEEDNVGNWFILKEMPLPGYPSVVRTINGLNVRGKLKIKNFEKNCPRIHNTTDLNNYLHNEDGFRIFYHGTDHASAKHIIENGISLYRLRSPAQDFSCGTGFYLTDKFETDTGAAQWACHQYHKHQSVLIFKIPNDEFEKFQGKNLFGDEETLKKFIKRYRIDKGKGVDKEQRRKDFEKVSFIEGPWVRLDGKRFRSAIEGSYQICLHSAEVAHCFDRYLDIAIFFDTSSTS